MKELKIDPKLQALFKPLPEKELEELREKLLTKYDGTPLYIWKEEIIVDGHNRYPILKENNIDFKTTNVEDFLGQDCTKADVMQWMIAHQQARRNLELGELIFANSMVAEEIALENKEKQLEGTYKSHEARRNGSVQMDGSNDEKKSHTSPTHTREQVAKLSGVGVGTVARYDAVMKSDDEDLKRKVQTGEVKIGTAYREVKKKKESKPTNAFSYKDVTNNYAGTQSSGHFGEYYETEKTTDKTFTEEDVIKAYEDTKTLKNALDMLNIADEFNTFGEDVTERLNTYKNRLFNIYHIQDKISETEREYAIKVLGNLITNINEIINTIKGE
jgi:hypothetical protein